MTKTKYQVFNSEDDLKQFVIENDPMKTFVPVKREINWNPEDRNCTECGQIFSVEHPAQFFCKTCAAKTEKEHKREAVVHRMRKKPTIANCEVCDNEYKMTAPGMKKCINCSPKGGELVQPDNGTENNSDNVVQMNHNNK
jgi:hypothetical protein